MCQLRRVFFDCNHEDEDVTPPRAIVYCEDADICRRDSSGSIIKGSLKTCVPFRDLPLTTDRRLAIERPGLCDMCAAQVDAHVFGYGRSWMRWPTPPAEPESNGDGPGAVNGGSQESATQLEQNTPEIDQSMVEDDSPELLVPASETREADPPTPAPANGAGHSEAEPALPARPKQREFLIYDDGWVIPDDEPEETGVGPAWMGHAMS